MCKNTNISQKQYVEQKKADMKIQTMILFIKKPDKTNLQW